jgi:hypothetical protein
MHAWIIKASQFRISLALFWESPSPRETIMSEIGKHKLADAIPHQNDEDKGGKPVPTHETSAEQIKEGNESAEAHDAEASNRERMVNIGRGNQQAGRQGQ